MVNRKDFRPNDSSSTISDKDRETIKKNQSKSVPWVVYKNGKRIDEVFYNSNCDKDYVKESLVNHDGYDNDITLRRGHMPNSSPEVQKQDRDYSKQIGEEHKASREYSELAEKNPKDSKKLREISHEERTHEKELKQLDNEKHNLTIEETYVPRGSGNNPEGGKRDLHYKIKEWGYIFSTKEEAEKYANEHESKNGVIIEKKQISTPSRDYSKEYAGEYNTEYENMSTKEKLAEDKKHSLKIVEQTKPTELPIYKIKGKLYYRDVRLGEYRNIHDINDKKDINYPNEYLEKPKKNDFEQDKYSYELNSNPNKYREDSKHIAKTYHGYVIGRKLIDDDNKEKNFTFYPKDYHGKPPYLFKTKKEAETYYKKHPDKFDLQKKGRTIFKYTPQSYLDRY